MAAVALSENIINKLNIIDGDTIDEKIDNLLYSNILLKLKECEEWIFRYESRYCMNFESFEKAWEGGSLKDKHSHFIERDFMEWEGIESERQKWLELLSEAGVRTGTRVYGYR